MLGQESGEGCLRRAALCPEKPRCLKTTVEQAVPTMGAGVVVVVVVVGGGGGGGGGLSASCGFVCRSPCQLSSRKRAIFVALLHYQEK